MRVGENGTRINATMRTYLENLDDAPKRRNVVAAVFVALVFLALAIAVIVGVKALLSADVANEAPVDPAPLVIEEYEPVAPSDEASPEPSFTPEDVDGPVYASSGQELEKPAGKIKTSLNGLYDMDISTYTDHQIAYLLAAHARHILEPDSRSFAPMHYGGNRWWYDVVTTPSSEGGPSLNDPARYAEILDRWHADDYSQIHEDLEWLRTPVNE